MTTNSILLHDCSREDLYAIIRDAVREVMKETATEAKKPRFLSRQEVCDRLGISLPSFHVLVNRGIVPVHKVGRRTLVDESVLEELIRRGMVAKYGRNREEC